MISTRLPETAFQPFPGNTSPLLAVREKGMVSRFAVTDENGHPVARLDWAGIFHYGKATGQWEGGSISFQRKKWWSGDLTFTLNGTEEEGALPFRMRKLRHEIEWHYDTLDLKQKGWFMRRFELVDAGGQLLSTFSVRERFISFKIEIQPEPRLYKMKRPEALLLTSLYLLITRIRNARSAQ